MSRVTCWKDLRSYVTVTVEQFCMNKLLRADGGTEGKTRAFRTVRTVGVNGTKKMEGIHMPRCISFV